MRGLVSAGCLLLVVMAAVAPLAEAQGTTTYRAREPVVLLGDVGFQGATPLVAHLPEEGTTTAWTLEADHAELVLRSCSPFSWTGCDRSGYEELTDVRIWVEAPEEDLPLLYQATDADGAIVGHAGNLTTARAVDTGGHRGSFDATGYTYATERLSTDLEAATVHAELHGGTVHWEGTDATGDQRAGQFDAGPQRNGFFESHQYVEIEAEAAEVVTDGHGAVTSRGPTLSATDGAVLTLEGGATTVRQTLTLKVTGEETDDAGDTWLLLTATLGAALVPTDLGSDEADDGPGPVVVAAIAVASLGGLGVAAWYSPYLRYLASVGVVPLYSRIKSGEVMDHETREQIYALVQEHPGIHAQEIRARTGVGWGTAVYHLKLLEEHKLVVSERQGRYKRFFLSAGYTGRKKEAYGVLRNESTARIAQFVSDHPGCMQREVCDAVGMSPSLVTWHIKKLEAADLVKKVREGRTVHYYAGPAWDSVSLTESQLNLATASG